MSAVRAPFPEADRQESTNVRHYPVRTLCPLPGHRPRCLDGWEGRGSAIDDTSSLGTVSSFVDLSRR
jgi:hypothetical protein